jgi:hypothetical protein
MPESLHSFFLEHDGIDWAAAVFMFLSMYRLGIHKKDGFVFAALASICWIIFNLRVDSSAGVIANIIIAIMAFRSLTKWNAPKSESN